MPIFYVRQKAFVPIVDRKKWSIRRGRYKRDLLYKVCHTASAEKVEEYHLEEWCKENNITIRPPKTDQPNKLTLDSWAHLSPGTSSSPEAPLAGSAAQDSFLEPK